MKILLHENSLNLRGTSVAVYDYAYFLKKIYNYDCHVVYDKNQPINDANVIKKFENEFTTISYNNFNEVDGIIKSNGIDLFYIQKSGDNDGKITDTVKSCVHAVFIHSLNNVHGDVYAYISEWLSDVCSNKTLPYVPYMINLPKTEEDLRDILKIPKDCIVFGRYGGYDSFDIPFVYSTIHNILNERNDIYFLFCNTERFIDHPRVLFLNGTASLENKVKFINTCDALIHARYRGETFGLTVAEFMYYNKPVFTYANSPEKNHICLLGGKGYEYVDHNDLFDKMKSFSPHNIEYSNIHNFMPENVIGKFKSVFID